MVDVDKKTRWKEILVNIEIEFRVGNRNKAFSALIALTDKIIDELPEVAKHVETEKKTLPMPPLPTEQNVMCE